MIQRQLPEYAPQRPLTKGVAKYLGSLSNSFDPSNKTVIDLECGNAANCYAFYRRGFELTVGLSSDDKTLDQNRSRQIVNGISGDHLRFRSKLVSAGNQKLPTKFDVSLLTEGFGKVKDSRRTTMIEQAQRYTKVGGLCIISGWRWDLDAYGKRPDAKLLKDSLLLPDELEKHFVSANWAIEESTETFMEVQQQNVVLEVPHSLLIAQKISV